MLNSISKFMERPSLYRKSEVAFWDDEYISKQMLKNHLDPDCEGASRKLKVIEKSVAWINKIVPPKTYLLLLDVGCGPGIYAEKFAKTGYKVTGIDFSKWSIKYAQTSAINQDLDITYHYQNYLNMDLNKSFDFATMIYCDYGALSTEDRKIIMKKIYQHLKLGGKFLLDVFSLAKYNDFLENQTWNICRNGGFWRDKEYIELSGRYKYSDTVTLEQIAIISNHETATYYLWNSYFTVTALIKEANDAGFKGCQSFSDVMGSPYKENSFTIAMLLEK